MLLAKAEDRHSANYVFTNVESMSGWTPSGFSFLFGFLSVRSVNAVRHSHALKC